MLKKTTPARGTVETAVQDRHDDPEQRDVDQDGGFIVVHAHLADMYCVYPVLNRHTIVSGTVAQHAHLSGAIRAQLQHHYNAIPGSDPVFHALQSGVSRESNVLTEGGTFLRYAVRNGRRIVPVNRAINKSCRAALVKVDLLQGSFHGEVLEIFEHQQRGQGTSTFAEMRWLDPSPKLPVKREYWSTL